STRGTCSRHGTAPHHSSPHPLTITPFPYTTLFRSTSFTVNATDVAPSVAADNASVTFPELSAASNTGTFADVDDAVTISADVGWLGEDACALGTWCWTVWRPDEASQYTVTITAKNA